jgi:hypothetical protein
MNDLLQDAIDNLSINDVYLLNSQCSVSAEFNAKYDDLSELTTQVKFEQPQTQIMEFADGNKFLRIICGYGCRRTKDEEGQESMQAALIEASFVAEYRIKNDISDESIAEFAKKNVNHHVWPFWREFLMSQIERLRLPRMTVHMFQFGLDAGKEGTSSDTSPE